MKNLVLIVFVLVSTVAFSQHNHKNKENNLKQLVSEIQVSLELDDAKTALLYDAMKEKNIEIAKIKKEADAEGLDQEAKKERVRARSKEFRATLTEILGKEDFKKYQAFFKERMANKKAEKNK